MYTQGGVTLALTEEVMQENKCPSSHDISALSDEDLVVLARNNNTVAYENIISRYKNLVRSKSRSYFLIGADKDDIIQEGMIGLFKAIRDYKLDKSVAFRGFADICISRQIITAVKTATRNKHIPLNTYISFSTPVYETDAHVTLEDIMVENHEQNPENLVIIKEDLKNIEKKITDSLSLFEYNVLEGYLGGHSYQEIASELGKHVKSVDNALQRIKRKLEDFLKEE